MVTNGSLTLEAASRDGEVSVALTGADGDFRWADHACRYEALVRHPEGLLRVTGLQHARIEETGRTVTIAGDLAGLRLTQVLRLEEKRAMLDEHITLSNPGKEPVALADFRCGMVKRFACRSGQPLEGLAGDRWIAVPFRDQPGVAPGIERRDFGFDDLIRTPGREPALDEEHPHGYTLSDQWGSEGWAWIRGDRSLGVFKLNQQHLEYSAISAFKTADGIGVRFGGAAIVAGHPELRGGIASGQSVRFGLTRYQLVSGRYREVCYAFRDLLDENGCRFPADYDPPVHWNELYDTDDWNIGTPGHPAGIRRTRPYTFTRAVMLEEAEKARRYGCEALYFDPGWDTHFGEFTWGTEWLGDEREFIGILRDRYGLRLSLHFPFATWLSLDEHGGRGVSSWPREAFRVDARGVVLEGKLCMGSKQYRDEALRRIEPHCENGIRFIMVDGNWYPGECHAPDHGHPVPYSIEDHWAANMDLVTRIHRRHPGVLIELHDPVTWALQRYSPIYYQYGTPFSWDENWAIEMMWKPMEDIKTGKALCLYYANLAANIPFFVHVDLRTDNRHCLVLWWFASTCRHFGMGGTHTDPSVVLAQQSAMATYRRFAAFYKRGEFRGYGEEVHVHVLPRRQAFVVNLFNLSPEERRKTAEIDLKELGLDVDRWYFVGAHGNWFDQRRGMLVVDRLMEPWSAQVFEIRAVSAPQ